MSKRSYVASMENAIRNNEMLGFAREHLNLQQFRRLYRAYRQLFWFQLSFPIAAVVLIAAACMLFREFYMEILLFGAVLFIFGFAIWLVLSQFVAGRLWHQYVKWYKKQSSMEELYQLFL